MDAGSASGTAMKQGTVRLSPFDSDEIFYVEVKVYKTPQSLRRAAKRWDRGGNENWSDTLGVCHCFEYYADEALVEREPTVAIIRLQEHDLGVGVVSHEATHAAVWIHELRYGADGIANGNDEELAWMVGEITRTICNFLIQEEYYDAHS